MRHSEIAAYCWMAAALMPGMVLGQAPDYPSRQVTIIVPTGPGASTDIEARLYAQKLTDRIGRSFVVDYKPGAGQTLGSAFVARANPDGHTLLTVAGSFTATPALMTLSYDPARDFAPILPAAEQGVAGYNYASWFGIVAPAGTPPAIIDKLNAELVRIAKLPDVMAKLEADGGSMVGSTPQQLRQVIVSEMSRYRKLIQDTGIKLEE